MFYPLSVAAPVVFRLRFGLFLLLRFSCSRICCLDHALRRNDCSLNRSSRVRLSARKSIYTDCATWFLSRMVRITFVTEAFELLELAINLFSLIVSLTAVALQWSANGTHPPPTWTKSFYTAFTPVPRSARIYTVLTVVPNRNLLSLILMIGIRPFIQCSRKSALFPWITFWPFLFSANICS